MSNILSIDFVHTGYFTIVERKQKPLRWSERENREDLDEEEQWFKQDAAPLHTANATMTWLREKLGGVTSAAKVKWNIHLNRLTMKLKDFFLCGFLKYNIYQGSPSTIAAVKAAITEKTETNTPEVYSRAINTFAFKSIFN